VRVTESGLDGDVARTFEAAYRQPLLKRLGETGRLGDWETGRLGDWETGRLGDWETGRSLKRAQEKSNTTKEKTGLDTRPNPVSSFLTID